ncbi:hypothetical protein [Helicobacter pylori]|uniref:hypothetical protein n=1 Tax=Helicobacter pylori TaxID=210 RepID=UPI003C6C5D69
MIVFFASVISLVASCFFCVMLFKTSCLLLFICVVALSFASLMFVIACVLLAFISLLAFVLA